MSVSSIVTVADARDTGLAATGGGAAPRRAGLGGACGLALRSDERCDTERGDDRPLGASHTSPLAPMFMYASETLSSLSSLPVMEEPSPQTA